MPRNGRPPNLAAPPPGLAGGRGRGGSWNSFLLPFLCSSWKTSWGGGCAISDKIFALQDFYSPEGGRGPMV